MSCKLDEVMNFEKKHVHEPYERIASHFNVTRTHTWPKISEFIQQLPPKTTVYDTPFQFSFWTLLKMSKMIIFFFLLNT